MPGTLKDIPVRWYMQGMNEGNLALIDELFDENVVFSSPSIGEGKGLAAAKAYIAPFRTAFPDVRVHVVEAIEAGNRVVVRWKFTGTDRGGFMTMPPTGRPICVDGMTILTVDNGKITEFHDYGDVLGILTQLRAEPPDIPANKALVHRYVGEFMNQRNWDLADVILAPDYVLHTPHLKPVNSAEDMKEHHRTLVASFPDVKITILDMVAEGDKVALRWEGGGTHMGEYMGIPPCHKWVTWSGTDTLRIADGRIAEEWGAIDILGFFEQTGALAQMAHAAV